MFWHRKFAVALGAAGMILAPAAASAQQDDVPFTLSPSGESAPSPAPAEPASAGAGAGYAQPGAALPGAEGAEGAEEQGFYHYDAYEGYVDERETLGTRGPVPELHVVRRGDTLWDLCSYYFNNSWEWPKIWSYNPAITNPHWIYPGDVVRLRPESAQARVVDVEPAPDAIEARAPTRAPSTAFRLRQLAFVEDEEIKMSSKIVGAEEERTMLSQNDVVYLEYPEGKPPQVGKRYAIYSETAQVKDTEGEKKRIGAYVRILGELEVLSVKKDKRARGVIREGHDVIGRGARVGPLQRTYRDVQPAPNAEDRRGSIVAQLSGDELIGALQLVFINLGETSGVEAGNRMFVIRRGDAMRETYDREVGEEDERFPSYAIGEILVVDVGKETSVGVVTLSLQEFEVGDHVLMRKAR
jgi:hypothetical protein